MVMEENQRRRLAHLLNGVADGSINKEDYLKEKSWFTDVNDPILDLIEDEVDDYWRNFEMLSLIRKKPVKPDSYQVTAARDTLRTLARALTENWTIQKIDEALRWI